MENYNPESVFLLDKWHSVKIFNSIPFFSQFIHTYVYTIIRIVGHLVLSLLLSWKTNTQTPRKFPDVHAMYLF